MDFETLQFEKVRMMLNLPGRLVNRVVGRFQERFGIERTRKYTKFYNGLRYGRTQRRAIHAYQNHFAELLKDNDPGFPGQSRNVIENGFAIDRSGDFPGIEETLAEADGIIEARGGVDRRGTSLAQTDWAFHLTDINEIGDFPDLLKLPSSSEVISTVANYMGMIPTLALNLPLAARVFESTERFNPHKGYSKAQLYHLDFHDVPMVYVILLAKDCTSENGPWCFLPKSASDRVVKALNYQKRGEPYRVTDERMYAVVDPSERIEFTGKRGDVLFIDSSQCFHYGSRDAVNPGYRVMYAFTTHCRSDFRMMLYRQELPIHEKDSRLKKAILGECF